MRPCAYSIRGLARTPYEAVRVLDLEPCAYSIRGTARTQFGVVRVLDLGPCARTRLEASEARRRAASGACAHAQCRWVQAGASPQLRKQLAAFAHLSCGCARPLAHTRMAYGTFTHGSHCMRAWLLVHARMACGAYAHWPLYLCAGWSWPARKWTHPQAHF